jgi:hypothetical protein
LENIAREHALETKTVGEREFFCVKARD